MFILNDNIKYSLLGKMYFIQGDVGSAALI